MRYVKPNAGTVATVANKVIPAADFFAGFFLCAFAAGAAITGFVLALAVNVFFLLIMLGAVPTIALYTQYFRGSVKSGTHSFSQDGNLETATKLWKQIQGSFTESYALPIMEKMFQHAATKERHDYGCRSCAERAAILAKLVPPTRNANDRSDIQAALEFIEAREAIES